MSPPSLAGNGKDIALTTFAASPRTKDVTPSSPRFAPGEERIERLVVPALF